MMFQTASQIESISTRRDKTIKIVVGTQELEASAMATLFGLQDKIGWFLFSENEIEKADIPEEPSPEFKTDKSPSKQLRDILWHYWDKNTSHKPDFETFYRLWIQKKIKEIQDTLPTIDNS